MAQITLPTSDADEIQNVPVSETAPTNGQVLSYNSTTGQYEPATATGDVTGPGSATDSNFASFNGTGGKTIKDSGSKAADFATSAHTHASYVVGPASATDSNFASFDSTTGKLVKDSGSSSSSFATSGHTHAADDLSDVAITSAAADDILVYNGSSWVNTPRANAGGSGQDIEFFIDDTSIIGTGANNDYELNTLTKTPNTGTAEQVDAISCANNTVLKEVYLYDTALTGSNIDAGQWTFHTYASVNSVLGGRVSSITINIYQVKVGTGTLTVTGSSTSRTATASSGTPFAAGDANAAIASCGLIVTPQGVYPISAYTSATEVTITTPSGYSNESSVAYTVYKRLFGVSTGTITSTGTNYTRYETVSVQGATALAATDKLAAAYFGVSNNTTTVNFTHNGTTRYSHFTTPLITRHKDLAGLQGGTTAEYYHLTSTQHTTATALPSVTFSNEPSSDHTGQGLFTTGTSGEALALGDLVYMKSDGELYKAKADASTTVPAIGIAYAAADAHATATILLQGLFRDDSYTWTAGQVLYVSAASAGAIVSTAPAAAGNQVQVVGVALTDDCIYVRPDFTIVEVG